MTKPPSPASSGCRPTTSCQLRSSLCHFVLDDLRKFTEQYGDIIRWDQSNRAYVMTHSVSDIDWKHYKHPQPEHVYDVYMHCWKDHDLDPQNPKKNAKEADRTSATLRNAQLYIFMVIYLSNY